MHRRQTQNLTPLHFLKLRSNNTIEAGTNQVTSLRDQHTRVIVELDDAAIWTRKLLLSAHDDGVADVAATHFVGCRGADGRGAWAGLGAEVALLLDDYYYALALKMLDI